MSAIAGSPPTPAARMLGRTPHPSPSTIATALALAFLAADTWTAAGLIGAGSSVLGARRRWLPPLVTEVLGSYLRAPRDAPRQLATSIELSDTFRAAVQRADERRSPILIVRHELPVAEARGTADHVPRIGDLAELAGLLAMTTGDLDWFADAKLWNRRARPGRLHHYRYEWRTRPGKVPRLLEVPGYRLREVQRAVLASMLSPIPTHDAAHGFVPGRSAATGAALHTGAEVVIALDLSTFFARVTAGRVYGVLRQSGYPEAVAHSLTGICTHAVPTWILAAMPSGGTPEQRFALRRALAAPHLPQGAPTSPTLANLAIRRLDSRLSGWADAAGATYTRYANDLAFSGGHRLASRADAFVRGVIRIVEGEEHSVNMLKTRVRGASRRQVVTGIVVNERTNVPRSEFDRLRAILHNCAEQGAASQNRDGRPEFRSHLLGRISWIESLNPARGARLRRDFARIRW